MDFFEIVEKVSDSIIMTVWAILSVLLIIGIISRFKSIISRIDQFTHVKIAGVEIEFSSLEEALSDSVEKIEPNLVVTKTTNETYRVQVSELEKNRVINRLLKNRQRVAKLRILWVDDHPENNDSERDLFAHLGAKTTSATSNEKAIERLKRNPSFDIIISDISRDTDESGIELLKRVSSLKTPPPIVYYVGELLEHRGNPPGAFGITNRPDTLVDLVLDATEADPY